MLASRLKSVSYVGCGKVVMGLNARWNQEQWSRLNYAMLQDYRIAYRREIDSDLYSPVGYQ